MGQAQIGEDCDYAFFTWSCQTWTLVNNSTGLVEIHGTANHSYVDDDDGDWNVNIFADADSRWVLTNRSNTVNDGEYIQLEVKTSRGHRELNLAELFPPKTPVTAKGWWVQDEGWLHANKTELHPLVRLEAGGLDANDYRVLIAQDASDRFNPGQSPIFERIVLDMFSVAASFPLINGTQQPWPGVVVREEGLVDDVYSDVPVSAIHRTKAQALLNFKQVIIMPSLGPYVDAGLGGWEFDPLYFAKFKRWTANLVTETSRYRLDGTGTGKQKLVIAVSLKLQGPADSPNEMVFSHWRLGSEGGTPLLDRRLTGSAQEIQFELTYAPGSGYKDSRWVLDVVGSSQAESWSPSELPLTQGRRSFQRDFVSGARTYSVTPSSAQLKSAPRQGTVTASDGTSATCPQGFDLHFDTSTYPGVDLSKVEWLVRRLANSDGKPPLGKALYTLQGGKLSLSDADFLLDASDDRHLIVSFKNTMWEHGALEAQTRGSAFRLLNPYIPANKSRFEIAASITTGLGEQLQDQSLPLDLTCGESGSWHSVPLAGGQPHITLVDVITFDAIERTLSAILWSTGHSGAGSLASLPIAQIRAANPKGFAPLGERDLWQGKLSPEGKALAEAYFKRLEGKPISPAEQALFDKAVQIGKTLPKIMVRPKPRR